MAGDEIGEMTEIDETGGMGHFGGMDATGRERRVRSVAGRDELRRPAIRSVARHGR